VTLAKGLPIGAMVTGAGGIGNESIDTPLKDLRRRFSGKDTEHSDWKLDPSTYTVEQVSIRVREFLFEEKSLPHRADVWTKVRICGYSAGRPLAEVWEVQLMGQACARQHRSRPSTSSARDGMANTKRWTGLFSGSGPGSMKSR
jgi:hypothetical protein